MILKYGCATEGLLNAGLNIQTELLAQLHKLKFLWHPVAHAMMHNAIFWI